MFPAFATQTKQKWKAGGLFILFWKLAVHAFKYICNRCIHSWLKIKILLTICLYSVKWLWHQGFLTFLPFCFSEINQSMTSFIQMSASLNPLCPVLPSWPVTAWHLPMGCVQLCPPLWLTRASCQRLLSILTPSSQQRTWERKERFSISSVSQVEPRTCLGALLWMLV